MPTLFNFFLSHSSMSKSPNIETRFWVTIFWSKSKSSNCDPKLSRLASFMFGISRISNWKYFLDAGRKGGIYIGHVLQIGHFLTTRFVLRLIHFWKIIPTSCPSSNGHTNSSGIHQKWTVFASERFPKKHQNWWYCLIFNMCGKEVAILKALWTKSTLWTVPIVVWFSKLIQNALGGRCPDLALSPKTIPMPVR